MTKEEINNAVAEKVMGWHLGENNDWILPDDYWAGYFTDDWNPSERIDHAWMVVEKLDLFSVGYLHKLNITKEWIFASKDHLGKILGKGDTAPMAICLAALEAVKEKEDTIKLHPEEVAQFERQIGAQKAMDSLMSSEKNHD